MPRLKSEKLAAAAAAKASAPAAPAGDELDFFESLEDAVEDDEATQEAAPMEVDSTPTTAAAATATATATAAVASPPAVPEPAEVASAPVLPLASKQNLIDKALQVPPEVPPGQDDQFTALMKQPIEEVRSMLAEIDLPSKGLQKALVVRLLRSLTGLPPCKADEKMMLKWAQDQARQQEEQRRQQLLEETREAMRKKDLEEQQRKQQQQQQQQQQQEELQEQQRQQALKQQQQQQQQEEEEQRKEAERKLAEEQQMKEQQMKEQQAKASSTKPHEATGRGQTKRLHKLLEDDAPTERTPEANKKRSKVAPDLEAAETAPGDAAAQTTEPSTAAAVQAGEQQQQQQQQHEEKENQQEDVEMAPESESAVVCKIVPLLKGDVVALSSDSGKWLKRFYNLTKGAELELELSRGLDPKLPAQEFGPPLSMTIDSPNGQQSCAGEYMLEVNVRVNGCPIWKKVDSEHYLYSGKCDAWLIGGKREKKKKFNCSSGYMISWPHNGSMPDKVKGLWRRAEGGSWLEDPVIRINPTNDFGTIARGQHVVVEGNRFAGQKGRALHSHQDPDRWTVKLVDGRQEAFSITNLRHRIVEHGEAWLRFKGSDEENAAWQTESEFRLKALAAGRCGRVLTFRRPVSHEVFILQVPPACVMAAAEGLPQQLMEAFPIIATLGRESQDKDATAMDDDDTQPFDGDPWTTLVIIGAKEYHAAAALKSWAFFEAAVPGTYPEGRTPWYTPVADDAASPIRTSKPPASPLPEFQVDLCTTWSGSSLSPQDFSRTVAQCAIICGILAESIGGESKNSGTIFLGGEEIGRAQFKTLLEEMLQPLSEDTDTNSNDYHNSNYKNKWSSSSSRWNAAPATAPSLRKLESIPETLEPLCTKVPVPQGGDVYKEVVAQLVPQAQSKGVALFWMEPPVDSQKCLGVQPEDLLEGKEVYADYEGSWHLGKVLSYDKMAEAVEIEWDYDKTTATFHPKDIRPRLPKEVVAARKRTRTLKSAWSLLIFGTERSRKAFALEVLEMSERGLPELWSGDLKAAETLLKGAEESPGVKLMPLHLETGIPSCANWPTCDKSSLITRLAEGSGCEVRLFGDDDLLFLGTDKEVQRGVDLLWWSCEETLAAAAEGGGSLSSRPPAADDVVDEVFEYTDPFGQHVVCRFRRVIEASHSHWALDVDVDGVRRIEDMQSCLEDGLEALELRGTNSTSLRLEASDKGCFARIGKLFDACRATRHRQASADIDDEAIAKVEFPAQKLYRLEAVNIENLEQEMNCILIWPYAGRPARLPDSDLPEATPATSQVLICCQSEDHRTSIIEKVTSLVERLCLKQEVLAGKRVKLEGEEAEAATRPQARAALAVLGYWPKDYIAWARVQDQVWKNHPPLAPGWFRIWSKSKDREYYFRSADSKTTFDIKFAL